MTLGGIVRRRNVRGRNVYGEMSYTRVNTAADNQSFISYFQHILVDYYDSQTDKVIDSLANGIGKFDRMIKRLSHGC